MGETGADSCSHGIITPAVPRPAPRYLRVHRRWLGSIPIAACLTPVLSLSNSVDRKPRTSRGRFEEEYALSYDRPTVTVRPGVLTAVLRSTCASAPSVPDHRPLILERVMKKHPESRDDRCQTPRPFRIRRSVFSERRPVEIRAHFYLGRPKRCEHHCQSDQGAVEYGEAPCFHLTGPWLAPPE